VARLILDTGVIVAAARGTLDLARLSEQDDLALPALAIAEYLTGVALDTNPARKAAHSSFLREMVEVAPIVDYTRAVAEHHVALMAYVRRVGRPRGAHDLIIAASARATGRTLLTTDARASFEELPDVECQLLTG
jgi:tRNA(fMet)-specific endonuclease VapC